MDITTDKLTEAMERRMTAAVDDAERIVIIQADNPDADSLGSALALENILGDRGKEVILYCGIQIPSYLGYIHGWDRVVHDLPSSFDLSIIVDASTYILIEKLISTGQFNSLRKKPGIVLDHHATVEQPLDHTDMQWIDPGASSTGEMIYRLCIRNGWGINRDAATSIMASILGDTQGLMNDLTTSSTYRTMAALTECGAVRGELEERRREFGKMPSVIYAYKGRLLQRTSFAADGQIAYLVIPQAEINEYSPLYNPAPLVQFDMLQVDTARLAIVFKTYDDGRITASLRSNPGSPVCAKLAEYMGGGGHANASGFKITDGQSFEDVKNRCISKAIELLSST